MIGDALRAIVDLLKIKKDARKTDLEFDPKTRRIIDDANTISRQTMQYRIDERPIRIGIRGWAVLVVWLIVIVSVVVGLIMWLYSLVVH